MLVGQCSNPGRGKTTFSSPKRPDVQPASCSISTVVFSPGVKRPKREVNHLPPFSAEVKKEWSHASTPHICLLGVDRENFILLLIRGVAFLTYLERARQ